MWKTSKKRCQWFTSKFIIILMHLFSIYLLINRLFSLCEWTVSVDSKRKKIIWLFDFMSKHCSTLFSSFYQSRNSHRERKTRIENLFEAFHRNYHNNGEEFILLILILGVALKMALRILSIKINCVDIHWPVSNEMISIHVLIWIEFVFLTLWL